VSGPRGGDFTLASQAGRLRVRRGVPRPPTTRVALRDEDALALLRGTLVFEEARRDGAIEVEGDERGAEALGHTLACAAQRRGLWGQLQRLV
jgi:hypothetical protein